MLAGMLEALIAKYDRPVPRYTSYPTAPYFHAGIRPDKFAIWLKELDSKAPLALYLHVPYCRQMCWYCGCNTQIVARYQPVADFVDALVREIALVGGILGNGRRIDHVHFGGGSPNMLKSADLARVLVALRTAFFLGHDAELAIELDPRLIDAETVEALTSAGITRASLGVQDFNEDVQQAVNRIQPFDLVRRAVEDLRHAGTRNLNLDLMYGLPRQSLESVEQSAKLAASLKPDRLAVFGYAHVPWMKPHQRKIDEAALPGPLERYRQFEVARGTLMGAGYRPIGLDHFAREGDALTRALDAGTLRRNFQGYTADADAPLIGFGPSAISSLSQGYVQNLPDTTPWARALSEGKLPIAKGITLSPDDRLRRAIIEKLMCFARVDLIAEGMAQTDIEAAMVNLAPMIADGLVKTRESLVTVTKIGRSFLRVVAAQFDAYLDAGQRRHSRAV